MINMVAVTGRLTKDPELITTQSNVNLCNVTVAVNRQKDKNGEQKADFFRVIVFNKQAENLVQYQKKGSLLAIDGRLQTSNYKDKDGNQRISTEIVAKGVHFLESKSQNSQEGTNTPGGQNNGTQRGYGSQSSNASYGQQSAPEVDDPSDDLPF